jgi:hypothetical protein
MYGKINSNKMKITFDRFHMVCNNFLVREMHNGVFLAGCVPRTLTVNGKGISL